MTFRDGLVVLGLIAAVVATLRRPYFGALAILMSAVLRDTLIVETEAYFFDIHGPEVLYLTTILAAAFTRPELLGRFVPRTMVDWGMLGFFVALVTSGLVAGLDVLDHKYIDLFFKATVLYFLLSRLADTPGRVMALAVAIIVPTAYLAVLAWSKYRLGIVRFARPYLMSSYHDFGLQMVLTLPLAGVFLARPFHLPARATLLALVPILLLVYLGSQSWGEFGMLAGALTVGALAAMRSALPLQVALLGLIPLFVLTGLRTSSRSTYLGLFLGLAMLAWFHRRRWPYVLALGVPLVAYAVVHNPEGVLMRLTSIWTGQVEPGVQDISIQQRKEQMRTAMTVIASNPIFGIGPRQFLAQYTDYVDQTDALGGTFTMHSVPLLILCEEGLLGFGCYFGLMVIGTLIEAARTLRRTRGDPAMETIGFIAAGSLMSFLAFLGYGVANPSMWVINIYSTVALLTAAHRVSEASAQERAAEEAEPAQAPSAGPAAGTEIVFS